MKAAKRFFILLTLSVFFFSISPFSSYANNTLPPPRLHNGQPCLKPDGTPCEQRMYFFLHDHLGGITATVDENGNVVERNDYFPYGTERMNVKSQGAPSNSYLFTQGEYDENLGLYYFNKRWYDPKLGRFMSPDPLLLNPQISDAELQKLLHNPQSLNMYSYAGNNPVNFKDPKGESPILAVLGFAASLFYTFFSSAHDVLAPAPEDLPVQTKSDVQIAIQTVSSAIKGSSVVKTITEIAQLGFKTIQELRAYRDKEAGFQWGYRYMSKEELEEVKRTGMLRGGKEGDTYWTNAKYTDPNRARQRLSLEKTPEIRLKFEIKNQPTIEETGSKVQSKYNMPGGGKEYYSPDKVQVKIEEIHKFKNE